MTKTRRTKKSDCIEVRLTHEAKEAFMTACRAKGVTASDVLRGFIDRYVQASRRASFNAIPEPLVTTLSKTIRRPLLTGGASLAAAGLIALAYSPAPAQAEPDKRAAALFEWMDADGDGVLSHEEFTEFSNESDGPCPPADEPPLSIAATTKAPHMPGETPDDLFGGLDADGNGFITLAEFDAGLVMSTTITGDISAADANGDGKITAAELAAWEANRQAACRADAAEHAARWAAALMAHHDRDGDGAVTLSELSD